MVRPVYRSRLFWLGLLPLLFLLWAWWDSTGHCSTVVRQGGRSYWQAHSTRGLILVSRNRLIGRWAGVQSFWERSASLPQIRFVDDDCVAFPPAARTWSVATESRGVTFQAGFVAYWLLALVYLVVWLGFLGWWWRRRRTNGVAVRDGIGW